MIKDEFITAAIFVIAYNILLVREKKIKNKILKSAYRNSFQVV